MKMTPEKSDFTRVLWRGCRLILLSALITASTLACTNMAPATLEITTSPEATLPGLSPAAEKPTPPAATPTPGLDFSTTRLSENGLFRVSYASSQNLVPVNQMHQWTLHVETADGQLVENANITVDGDMPEHGHGLPTRPQVTDYLGNGDYLVEGVKFQMGGWWVMDFTITANEQTDAVRFNMRLN